MRKKLSSPFLVILGLLGMVGCSEPLTGTLRIAANETVRVRDSNGDEAVLRAGRASVQLDGDSLIGSTRTLTLENQGQKSKIRIPDSAFLSASDFSVSSSEIRQNFDLVATTRRQLVGAPREEKGTVSCTYAGYCLDCSLTLEGKMDCSQFKYKLSCSGTQSAVLSKQNYRDVTSIAFLRQNKPVAVFTSDAPIEVSSQVLRTTGSCNDDSEI